MAARRSKILRIAAWIVAIVSLLGVLLVRCDVPRVELVKKYGGPPSQFTEIEGMKVHYRDEGHGAPLVLVHGTASSLHTWDGWTSRLSGGRRIVRLDLPGFGLTGPAADRDYRVARLARVVVVLMDQLGIARADIAGNSLGGRVGLTLALEFPTRVRRLILVDSAGLSGHRPAPLFALARIPVLNVVLRMATPRMFVAHNVKQVYGDPSRVTDALVDRYYDLTRGEGNRRAFVDRVSGAVDPELDARLSELHLPVLVMWGERDRWIPLAFGRRLHDGIAGSKLVTYPDAGHVPMEEIPDRTASDAEAFLTDPQNP